jgi:SAM-dependent methyltransferase
MSVVLRTRTGHARALDVDTWCAPASGAERRLLGSLRGPVLDLGCGPGRLVVALNELGIAALGVDASPQAIERARSAGAPTLRHSVFDPLPGEGRWPTILLFDGNVGIGGDPVRLLRRVAELLGPDGTALVEVEPPGSHTHSTHARLEREDETSEWFPWSWVSADAIDDLAARAGLDRRAWQRLDDRWLAALGAQP